MSDRITAAQLRARKRKKPASAEQKLAEQQDRAVHAQAAAALRKAGFDPKHGYSLSRATTGSHVLYVAVPFGVRDAT